MLPQGFGEIAEKLRRSTVRVVSGGRRGQGMGSGVIWTADGNVITNAHVVLADSPKVELWDGRLLEARVAARDARADLALLRLSVPGLSAIAWRASTTLRAGELVMAVGNPLGFVGALTTGVVHASGSLRGLGSRKWVQAAIRLAPGNSGGPLADAEGRVVGINTMVVAGGIALAIPSDAVVQFLKRGRRPALGVVVRPVTERGNGVGLLILEVLSGSAAESSSLLVGDLLVSVNGRRLACLDDLDAALNAAEGRVLHLGFLRGDRRRERQVAVMLAGARAEAA